MAKKRVMVVDDALFMRNMLRGILEANGFEVVAEAADGAEAVVTYRDVRPDIVTLDIIMPVKNGIEALREIMAIDPHARVVICSAVGQESLVQKAQSFGARDFILKPFNPDRVKEIIKKVSEG
ncbi:response regulator receiver protein [Geobacter metallireducens RCH3]|uniref:Response receiver CheY associated with MCPs of class 44H n=1 Tax=Geobacter metallireducens (strain ATCC 53774 / DSM 7210 / GS-15) TaxID=269799 RepID=Q39QQ0_GEOMG|nr:MULTISPECIES: response regulator [Geobacter]ABB33424.1 response receiver CheY associated with MCPs of class 44H [Geobacter metallireducens GS-15]EHP87476.1 response regulator receiver protein [Geobacter metallireducens RCH3]MBT1074749.1 response regulator [Geobacter grbiciae]